MLRIILNLLTFWNRISLPYKFGHYLKRGFYQYNDSVTILYPIRVENKQISMPKVFGAVSSNQNFFRTIFSKLFIFINFCKKTQFAGDLMIISSSETEFKFFDYSLGEVLTYYSDRKKLLSIYSKRSKWSEHFNVVNCVINENLNIQTEPLLLSVEFDSIEAFQNIKNDYLNYYTNNTHKFIDTYKLDLALFEKFSRYWKSDNHLLERVSANLAKSSIPISLSHGDLWKSNILYNGISLYYIDFEQVGYNFCIFDLMLYIISDSILLGDNRLLINYFEGEYDEYFKKISELIGFKYLSDDKFFYCVLTVFELFKNRWYGSSNEYLVYDYLKNINEFDKQY